MEKLPSNFNFKIMGKKLFAPKLIKKLETTLNVQEVCIFMYLYINQYIAKENLILKHQF